MTTISGRTAVRGIVASTVWLLLVTAVLAGQTPRDNGPPERRPGAEPMWRGGPGGMPGEGPGSRLGGPPPPPPPGGRGLGPREAESLDLTDEQFERVEELGQTMRRETRVLHKQMRQVDDQLRELWRQEQPDLTAIEAKLDEIGALQTRVAKRHAGFRVAVIELLTAAQREQAARLAD